jgi:hypothetical protein
LICAAFQIYNGEVDKSADDAFMSIFELVNLNPAPAGWQLPSAKRRKGTGYAGAWSG